MRETGTWTGVFLSCLILSYAAQAAVPPTAWDFETGSQGWMPLGHRVWGVRPIPTIVYESQSAQLVTLVTVFQPLREAREDRAVRVSYVAQKVIITYTCGEVVETVLPPS